MSTTIRTNFSNLRKEGISLFKTGYWKVTWNGEIIGSISEGVYSHSRDCSYSRREETLYHVSPPGLLGWEMPIEISSF